MAVIGSISGDGRADLIDRVATEKCSLKGLPSPSLPVNCELEKVLGDMPQITFEFHRVIDARVLLDIAQGIMLMDSLKRVLRLPSICSKKLLTTKVDRCVTGLVAQQQTVSPLQIPLADVAVFAQTYTDFTGGDAQPESSQSKVYLILKQWLVWLLEKHSQLLFWRKLRLYLMLKQVGIGCTRPNLTVNERQCMMQP